MEKECFRDRLQKKNIAMYLYNNHFCLIWKSEGVSFNQAVKELKDNFKIVDTYITKDNGNSQIKYEFLPKKFEPQLTHFIVYHLETHNTDRARPSVFCFYRLSKLAGKYNRDLTRDERQKCKRDTIAFDGDNCFEIALDFCLKLKKEEREDNKNKILENNLQLHAHNGSGFHTWMVLNNLSCDKRIVIFLKNGKSNTELKMFNGCNEKN